METEVTSKELAGVVLETLRTIRDKEPEIWDSILRTESGSLALSLWDMLKSVERSRVHYDTDAEYVSPEDQKRNDAIERGDYLRDRMKDEGY